MKQVIIYCLYYRIVSLYNLFADSAELPHLQWWVLEEGEQSALFKLIGFLHLSG